MRKGSTNGRKQAKNGRNEDCATTAKVVATRVGDPAADQSTPYERTCVDESDEEIVVPEIGATFDVAVADAEFDGEGQVCAV